MTQASLLCHCKNIRMRLPALTQFRFTGEMSVECLFMLLCCESSGLLGSPAVYALTSCSLE